MPSDPATTGTHSETPARRFPRPLLWALLIIALVANGSASIAGLPVALSATLGVLALALGALLVRDYYRGRTRP